MERAGGAVDGERTDWMKLELGNLEIEELSNLNPMAVFSNYSITKFLNYKLVSYD